MREGVSVRAHHGGGRWRRFVEVRDNKYQPCDGIIAADRVMQDALHEHT